MMSRMSSSVLSPTCPPAPEVACMALQALSLWWQIHIDPQSRALDATFLTTKVRNQDVNIPREGHRYEVSGLAVRCWVREPRT